MKKAGRTLIAAVIIFGLATVGFGLSRWFWLSLLMLFVCGFADNVSVIVRHTLVQLLTPDAMRGRVSSVNNLFIGTSNELGGFESGLVAQYFGPVFSVVSGGVATVFVVLAVAWIGRKSRALADWCKRRSRKRKAPKPPAFIRSNWARCLFST